MNLHTAKRPDWVGQPVENLNRFQQMADKTKGFVTPGNFITGLGMGLVYSGTRDLSQQKILSGTLKIGIGRTMDYFDGVVADKTKTKSPLGEAFDATADKLAIAMVGPALYKNKLVPKTELSLVIAQNSVNAIYTIKAKNRGNEIHPSKYGKLATVSQWAFIGSSLMEKICRDSSLLGVANIFNKLSKASFLSFLGFGSLASAKIIQDSNK